MKIHLDNRDGKFWVDEESFDKSGPGRNQFMSAVMRRVMMFEKAEDSLVPVTTDYHDDIRAGIAKPTNREDYFRGQDQQNEQRPGETQRMEVLRGVLPQASTSAYGPDGY